MSTWPLRFDRNLIHPGNDLAENTLKGFCFLSAANGKHIVEDKGGDAANSQLARRRVFGACDVLVGVAGKKLAEFPSETWLHIEIQAALGGGQPKTFILTLTPRNGKMQTIADLPVSGPDFRELHWLGFSSTVAADAAFYLDNLRVARDAQPR